jgi:hypothetical protein
MMLEVISKHLEGHERMRRALNEPEVGIVFRTSRANPLAEGNFLQRRLQTEGMEGFAAVAVTLQGPTRKSGRSRRKNIVEVRTSRVSSSWSPFPHTEQAI